MRRALLGLEAILLLLCVGALATACSGNAESRAGRPKPPAGFTLRAAGDLGFSIALPRRWRSLDADQALSSEQAKRFAKDNPQLRGELQALTRPNSPVKLVAVDPAARPGFLTNLNVVETRLPPSVSFAKWSAAEVAQIKLVPTVRDVRAEELQLPPGRALHLSYHARFNLRQGSSTAVLHQYLVKHDELLYVLTYTTQPAVEATYRATFEESARSFRLAN